MKVVLTLLLCLLVKNSVAAEPDYCRYKCRNPNIVHIGCNAKREFAPSCIRPQIIEMDSYKENLLLKLHNEIRNAIAGGYNGYPFACRMASIQWDYTLAYWAELSARSCKAAHDSCHETELFKFAGQNIALYFTNRPYDAAGNPPFDINAKIEKAVKEDWFGEIRKFSPTYIERLPNNIRPSRHVGHFTQLITGINTRIGCAISVYATSDGMNNLLIVCNYSKLIADGGPVYETCAQAAAKCTQTNYEFPNLCYTGEVYEENDEFGAI